MQTSYPIGSGTTMQENQSAVQIDARHNIFPQMAPYISWIFLALVEIKKRALINNETLLKTFLVVNIVIFHILYSLINSHKNVPGSQ